LLLRGTTQRKISYEQDQGRCSGADVDPVGRASAERQIVNGELCKLKRNGAESSARAAIQAQIKNGTGGKGGSPCNRGERVARLCSTCSIPSEDPGRQKGDLGATRAEDSKKDLKRENIKLADA